MTARQRCLIAVLLGLLVFAFTRIRVWLSFYIELHQWLHELGVPPAIRNLDGSLLLVVAAVAGAWIAARGNPLRTLGLLGSRKLGFTSSMRQGLTFGLIASVPMLLQAAITSNAMQFDWNTAKGVLIAPFVEETFYRGLLVAVPVLIAGNRFWPVAIASALFFGASHVPWSAEISAHHIWPFLITGMGGLWYAWLIRVYDWNLWPTIVLHFGMNAAWMVFTVGGGAVGSGIASNVGRALTIALGTVMALRYRRAANAAVTT